MSRILIVLSTLLLIGCAHAGQVISSAEVLCDDDRKPPLKFSREVVLIYPDQHGDYLKIEACPQQIFAVDWSRSGLYTAKYSNLLEKMRFNAMHGREPVRVTASGVFEIVNGEEGEVKRISIDEIVNYDLDKTL